MNIRTIWKRILRHLKLLSLACVAIGFAVPAASAQGNSANTPAAEHSKGKGGGHVRPDKGNQGGGGHGTAPVPEPATWVGMATLAALAAVLIARQRKLSPSA